MNAFKDFQITTSRAAFTGDKIKIDRILNVEIVVSDYKIEQSKYEGKGNCLHLQIEHKNNKHVVFTGSKGLMDQIQKVPRDKLPFKTTIIKENEMFQFT
jgi:hypothetical protein